MLEIRRATVLMRVAIKRVLSAACEQVNGENVHGDEGERKSRFLAAVRNPFNSPDYRQFTTSKISMKMQKKKKKKYRERITTISPFFFSPLFPIKREHFVGRRSWKAEGKGT